MCKHWSGKASPNWANTVPHWGNIVPTRQPSMFLLALFLNASGNIGGTATGLRGIREWGTFSSGSPRGALVRAGLSNKNRQRGSVVGGSDTPRAVGSANFIINHQSSLITHQSSVINHQSSIISYQSSIIHDQWSIINYQSSIFRHKNTSSKIKKERAQTVIPGGTRKK